ncbi:LuxR family transcriptional regulator [Streptomyces rhizosphaerihabitans]|uniref:LuxR family transcriptional regulator n=1 Tax=Streptomyces rhizosphaerihabitans TaxID=1266770 RepID=UPI0021C093A7|nr:LuxR family transcriptional regulator [Streptomyces rhizosphaerihabitans]MCT9005827.1 LuxR C-terminal-related transcriptional regulator [Streptomyces rhizosphaerihabitans]
MRVRVLRAAHGDRRVARELASVLTERQLAGLEPLPVQPPVLLRVYRQEIRGLPDSTRFLLLLAAADQYPVDTHAFLRAVTAARLDTRPIDAAEAAGLAHATAGGVVFRDPWTRIAAYETASTTEHRAVHRLLARVLRGEGESPRRSWHRGAAALGPSRRLAAELTAAASTARRVGEHTLACTLAERAAALAPEPGERTRLLARAAADAWRSGDGDRASRLVVSTDDDGLSGLLALRAGNATDAFDALLTAAVLHTGRADASAGVQAYLPGATESGARARSHGAADPGGPALPGSPGVPTHRDTAAHFLARATEAAIYTGDLRRCREAAAVADRLGIAPPGTLGGLAAAVEGRYDDARDALKAAAGRCGPGGDPTALIHSAIAALLLGDHTGAATAAVRAAAAARSWGETVAVPQAMEFRAYAEFWTGRPRAAEAATLDALRQAYATGQDNAACHLQAALAMFAALTGDEDMCRQRAGAARRYALERGLGLPAALALFALALLDLGAGRFAAAAARLRALAGFGPGHGHRAVRHLATPLYVEAAARTGETRVARAAHADYDHWARTVRSPDELALSARGRALLAGGAEAVDHYRTALDLHASSTRDFERARTELLFGGALRRLRQRTQARDRLHSALEAFEHFGSPQWAAQARAELRVLGESAVPARGAEDLAARLTAQQLMVARMAAEGATNREIAARLALSPRTIDHHLRGVFTRLGIRSRIELVRLLGDG